MADWAAFAGFAGVVLFALLFLSHVSKRLVSDGHAPSDGHGRVGQQWDGEPTPDSEAGGDGVHAGNVEPPADVRPERTGVDRSESRVPESDRSTTNLLVNVAISQGVFAAFLVLGAWYTEIPASALGVGAVNAWTLAVGVGVGVALYAVNEIGSVVGDRFGLGSSEDLREALAPESARGWLLLLLVVLPVIAGFEELLFRGVLVGAVSAGFAVSPWTMAAVSSVAFALGHGAQGPGGVAVTGALGFVLAAVFVLTQSLLVVILAHYLVNALEFVVHEGLGVEWS